MSRILLYDETDVAERFSSTETKLANLGSGTSTDRISVSTTIFMTTGPILTNGRCQPISVKPSYGSFDIVQGQSATVTTGLSRSPLANVDGGPNAQTLVVNEGTGDCSSGGTEIIPQATITDLPTNGEILIRDNDSADPSGGRFPDCLLSDASGFYYYL